VLQAYNSFQARWAIIQQRKLAEFVRADVLAVLLMLHYAWPKLFEQIFNYPELFFYLHALTKSVPNEICTETERQEVFDLGLLSTPEPPAWSKGLLDPDLSRLLQALPACPKDIERLVSHITMMPSTDVPAATGVHLNIPATSLLSGDPVLIKFAVRTSGWKQLIPILINSLSSLKLDTLGEDLDHAIKVVFALGRLRDERVLPVLIQLAHSADRLPVSLVLRVVYALAHQASNGGDQAFSELRELLKTNELSDAIRTRVAGVLQYCKPSDEQLTRQIACVLALLSPDWPARTSGSLRLSVKESLLAHPGQALRVLAQPQRLSPEDLLDLCAAATSKSESWPWRVARYLIALAKRPDLIGNRAFELIQGVADQAARVRWLIWVILTTERSRPDCLDLASKAQAAVQGDGKEAEQKGSGNSIELKLVPWQGRAWRLLAKRLTDEKQEEWLIDALGKTNHTEAVQMLKNVHDSISETRIREQIRQALANLSGKGVRPATDLLNKLDSIG